MDKTIRVVLEKLVDELNAQLAESGAGTINLYREEVQEINEILDELDLGDRINEELI